MEKMLLSNFIAERIEENKDLFTVEELGFIKENRKCIDKVYLLGAINSKECYQGKEFFD